jgi:opacity protein-like surface antigen
MRKVLLVALLVLLCGMYAVAQDYSKGEFFAGYSYLHIDCGSGCTDASVPAGFNLDGTYYFAKSLGLTADFQYHHKGLDDIVPGASATLVSFHAGPRFKARSGRLEPFAHALFGFTHGSVSDPTGEDICSVSTSCSDTAFSMKLGGGLDVAAGKHFAIRLGEFNYYMTRFAATSDVSLSGQDHQNNFTFSAGIVIR